MTTMVATKEKGILYKLFYHGIPAKEKNKMKLAINLNSKPQPPSNSLKQYLATISGCLSIVCTGMHFGWPSPSLPQLLAADSPIPMSSSDGSWMAVMPCLGAVVGSLLAASIVDKFGRKASMLITSPLYFLSWLLVAFSPSVWMLNAARFLAGTSDGVAFTVFPMYLGEIADSKIRGLLGSSITVSTTLGFLLINLVGFYLNIRNAALASSIVAVLHFATFALVPESPYYLLMKNQVDAARKSLQSFKGMEDVESELARLTEAVRSDLQHTGKVWDLFTVVSNRKALLIIAGLRGVQQLSGTTVITFYAKTIFQESGSDISPHLATVCYFVIQLIVSVIASILVDKVGRRPLLLVSLIGSGLALATQGLYSYFDNYTNYDLTSVKWLPIVALLGFVVIFNIGMGTIPVLMLGELFPTSVKAAALCFADIYFGIIVTVISKFFQLMTDNFGMHVPFLAFAGSCAVGVIFIALFVPETRGKTLEQIQEELTNHRKKESTISA